MIRIWDIETSSIVYELFGHSDAAQYTQIVWDLIYLKEKNYLVSSSNDKKIRIWDLDKIEQPIRTLTGHSQAVRGLAVLDNGVLASASHDKTIKLWDTQFF